VIAAVLHPLLRGRILFDRDILTYWYEEVEVFVRTVAAGSWPVWDPWISFGQPFLGYPDTQVFYPFTWLNLIAPPALVHTAFVLSHLLFAGLGVFLLGRRFAMSDGGAFVAAAAWTASGPFLSYVSLWHHFAGAAWIPWGVLAADACFAARENRRRATAAWGAVIGIQLLAGSADMAIMTGLVSAAVLARRHLVVRGVDVREKGRMLGAALLALLLGAGLGAALWLPAFDIARRSARWGLPSFTREYWSLHPWMLGQIGLPAFLVDLPLLPEWRRILFEGREPFLESFYLGLSTLGLAACALVARRGHAGFLAALAGLATAAALGRHTFVYGLLVSTIPGVSFLRYPQKAMIVTALLVALLAGLGFDAWSRPETWTDRRRARLVVGMLALLAATGLAATLVVLSAPDAVGARLLLPSDQAGAPPGMLLRPVLVPLATATAAAIVLLLAAIAASAGRLAPSRLATLAGLAVVADLVVAHQGVNPSAPRELVDFRSPLLATLRPSLDVRLLTFDYNAVPGAAERHLGRPVAMLSEVEVRGWSYRASVALGLQSYLPAPMGARYGLFGSFDIDPRALYAAPLDGLVRLFWSLDERPLDRLRLLQLGSVTHVVSLHGVEPLAEIARLPSLFADPILVFRVPDPAPRTYAVSGARPAAGGASALLDPAFDFRREVLLPGGTVRPAVPEFRGHSAVTAFTPDRVELVAELSHPGFVVLTDTADPGWRARVDGAPAQLLTANVAFRAVEVPAGRHRIEMRYRPRAITLGLAISLACLALGAAGWLWRRSP
jgi:hypothetical protein